MLITNINWVPFVDVCNVTPLKKFTLKMYQWCDPVDSIVTFEEENASNTWDCTDTINCINEQLALPWAWALSNFKEASVNAIVAYFSQTGVQAPTAAEVCAYLSSLPQNTTIDSTTKLVLGSCEYGTVGDLVTYLSSVISIDDQTITSSANTMSLTNGWTAPIVNSNVLSSAWLTLTSTVNWIADSEDITTAVQDLIDASTDVVTNTVAWHLIATHTSVDGTAVAINETVTSLWNWTLTGTVISIPYTDENGVTSNSNTDVAWLMNSAVFQSNDDQVLTAWATSDMDVQLVPTTVTDPDSQVDKVNYEISVTPKPTVICSGNPLSATNKLLTSDTLTTNVTAPVTVVATPDPTNAVNSFVKAVAVKNGCKEEQYVPAQRFPTRQTLTPTAIVTANPLVPDIINLWTKDFYQSTVQYWFTIPTGWNFLYDVATKSSETIIAPNHDWAFYHYILWTGISFVDEREDNYSKDQNRVYTNLSNTGLSWVVAPWTVISVTQYCIARVDTWIAIINSWGAFEFNYQSAVVTFIPTY